MKAHVLHLHPITSHTALCCLIRSIVRRFNKTLPPPFSTPAGGLVHLWPHTGNTWRQNVKEQKAAWPTCLHLHLLQHRGLKPWNWNVGNMWPYLVSWTWLHWLDLFLQPNKCSAFQLCHSFRGQQSTVSPKEMTTLYRVGHLSCADFSHDAKKDNEMVTNSFGFFNLWEKSVGMWRKGKRRLSQDTNLWNADRLGEGRKKHRGEDHLHQGDSTERTYLQHRKTGYDTKRAEGETGLKTQK